MQNNQPFEIWITHTREDGGQMTCCIQPIEFQKENGKVYASFEVGEQFVADAKSLLTGENVTRVEVVSTVDGTDAPYLLKNTILKGIFKTKFKEVLIFNVECEVANDKKIV